MPGEKQAVTATMAARSRSGCTRRKPWSAGVTIVRAMHLTSMRAKTGELTHVGLYDSEKQGFLETEQKFLSRSKASKIVICPFFH